MNQRFQAPIRYQLPTHLDVEDKIISYAGIGITVRQGCFLLIGASLSFSLWQHLVLLMSLAGLGFVLRLTLAGLPFLFAGLLGFLTIEHRTVESWLAMRIRYWSVPKLYLWYPYRPALPTKEPGDERASA